MLFQSPLHYYGIYPTHTLIVIAKQQKGRMPAEQENTEVNKSARDGKWCFYWQDEEEEEGEAIIVGRKSELRGGDPFSQKSGTSPYPFKNSLTK
jgi:hypothetical protein